VEIWYIYHRFGILYEEKSGNPDACSSKRAKITERFGKKFCLANNHSVQVL
jgi:hypothetical protein